MPNLLVSSGRWSVHTALRRSLAIPETWADYSIAAVIRSASLVFSATAVSNSNHTLNLVLAILATLFCCLPLGVAAIVFAAIGLSREGSGDYVGAASAARTARILIWVSAGIGLALVALYVLMVLLLGFGTFLLGF